MHICYIILIEHLRHSETPYRISEKRYTGLLSNLAGKLNHCVNISCRCSPNRFIFFDLGTYGCHIPAYQFSKQAIAISNCRATSKVAFCTSPATSGAGWPGHPNFEIPYLAQIMAVSRHTYTVRKVFTRAFTSRKNEEKRSTFEIVIVEIHKHTSWLTIIYPTIQYLIQSHPKLEVGLLQTSQVRLWAWTAPCVLKWSIRAKTGPLWNSHRDLHLEDAHELHPADKVVV